MKFSSSDYQTISSAYTLEFNTFHSCSDNFKKNYSYYCSCYFDIHTINTCQHNIAGICENYNELYHKNYCYCGDLYNLEYHAVRADETNYRFANCILCNYLIDLENNNVIIGPNSNKELERSVNGSYILHNGIVVLVDEDILSYKMGTLKFYKNGSLNY